jgi:hypothetical protein
MGKTMNENIVIDPEELRFIYKSILDGWSDADILEKYTALKGDGEKSAASPVDFDFIKSKRQEMEIVSGVLKDGIKEIIHMSTPKQKEGHFAQIVETSGILLENGLSTLVEYPSRMLDGLENEYQGSAVYTVRDKNDIPIRLNRMQLIEKFTKNVDKAVKMYGVSFFYDCYAAHLEASVGEEMRAAGGFWPELEKNPYKVIKAIKDISDSRKIKGACPLCNMEVQLPPFLKSAFSDILPN